MSIIFKLFLTIIPISFVIQLYITDYILNKKGIKLGGSSPINGNIFIISKYSVLIVWTGMILEIWDIHIIFNFSKHVVFSYIGIILWILGFTLLYIGRFSLGKNFRMGVADEKTEFIANGIYKISRNPMYLGLFITFFGYMFYSLNIIYIIVSIFIIIVHHLITLGEEKEMIKKYGDLYKEYCRKVRRYI